MTEQQRDTERQGALTDLNDLLLELLRERRVVGGARHEGQQLLKLGRRCQHLFIYADGRGHAVLDNGHCQDEHRRTVELALQKTPDKPRPNIERTVFYPVLGQVPSKRMCVDVQLTPEQGRTERQRTYCRHQYKGEVSGQKS